MGQLWCNNCLEAIENYPCPHCGYDPSKKNRIPYALTGHVLAGRYLVGRILGQGGFGITYLGMDMKLQTKVAIKEFYPSGHVSRYITMGTRLDWNHTPAAQAMRSNGVESFLKEARKMSKVSHIPNVVGVRDLIEENDTAYIIMNYISGITLKDLLIKEGPIDWPRAKDIFLPAIQTMALVHKAGLVHRDISPDNLMLQQHGYVQILDLGAAKDISVDGGLTSALVAKAGFSPLEQYGVTGKSGPWTDVYAMAATIYYTVTGVLPPLSTDRLDRDSLRWDLPRLQALPKQVVSALQKAMALRAQDRTQTMEDFLASLNAASEETAAPAAKEPAKKEEPVKKAAPAAEAVKKEASAGEAAKKDIPAAEAGKKEISADDAGKKDPPADNVVKKKRFLPLIAAVVCILLAVAFFGTPKRGDSNILMATNDPNTVFGKDFPRNDIISITFVDSLQTAPLHSWDVSQERDRSVLAWTKQATPGMHLYIGAEGDVIFPSDASNLFQGYLNAESILFGNAVDTSKVTNMGRMFYDCRQLTKLDLAGFDTSNVTDMGYMFANCYQLAELNLAGFDTSNVTDMGYMFANCYRLAELNLAGFDTSNVTNMDRMFFDCRQLTKLDLAGFDTSKVTDMGYMFASCYQLAELNLAGFDTSNVTNMGGMFTSCSQLAELNLAGFDTSNVTNMDRMFFDCRQLTKLDLAGFDTSNVTNMDRMFFDCRQLYELDLAGFDTSKVTDMGYMFANCYQLAELNLAGFDTSNVTNMDRMFFDCRQLIKLDLAGFDTSNVTNMDSMFYGCCQLYELDLSGFDFSNVTNKGSMFWGCYNLPDKYKRIS